LYADGCSVVLAERRREMLEMTAALAGTTPPKMLVVPTDVADPHALRCHRRIPLNPVTTP
jgi:hypothetical protein